MLKWCATGGAVALAICVAVPAQADSFSGDLFTTNLIGNRIAHVRYGFDSAIGGFGVGAPQSVAMGGGHARNRPGGPRGDALFGLPGISVLSSEDGVESDPKPRGSETSHASGVFGAGSAADVCVWDTVDDAGGQDHDRDTDAESLFSDEGNESDFGWLFGGGEGPGDYAGGGFGGGGFAGPMFQSASGHTPPPSSAGPSFGDYVDVLGTIGQRQFGSPDQRPPSAFTTEGTGNSFGAEPPDFEPSEDSPSDDTLPGDFESDVPDGQGPTLNTKEISYVDYVASHDTGDSGGDGEQGGEPKEGFARLDNGDQPGGPDGPSTPVPEPASIVLLGTGLLALARYRRWRIANFS